MAAITICSDFGAQPITYRQWSAGIFFVLRLQKMVINPQKWSTLPRLSRVVCPLCSQCPLYLCSLFLKNSFLSTELCVWKFLMCAQTVSTISESCCFFNMFLMGIQNLNFFFLLIPQTFIISFFFPNVYYFFV